MLRLAIPAVTIKLPGSGRLYGALAIAGLLAASQMAGAQRAGTQGPPRFPTLTMEQLDETQRNVAERVMKVSSAGLGGPYAMLLRSPKLLERYLGMTDYLRFETSMPKHLNEMAILMQARLWDAQYEWWAHYPIALKAGLRKEVADAIRDGRKPADMAPEEQVVWDVVTELLTERVLSDDTFQRARQTLGEQQIIDLVAVAGFYVMVSTVIHAGRVAVPNGDPLPLPTLIKK